MEYQITPLYEFRIIVEENLLATEPYRVLVDFSGDNDFYNKLLTAAKRDHVLLTGRPAPFVMKFLFKTQYIFYLEQQKNKPLKYSHWNLEDILKNKDGLLSFRDKAFVIEFREALVSYLNQFAKEVEKGNL